MVRLLLPSFHFASFLFLFYVLLCLFSSPPPCLKSFEGHPGVQWVDVMSANEPIDNLSIGWLVLQALTMCSTETFLAQALSLLDLCPTMPSIWAYKGCSESLIEKLYDAFIFFSAYHCTFKMNPYQRELLWRSIVAVTQIFSAGIECFEYKIFACILYVSDLLLFFLSLVLHYPPIFSFTWPVISRRVPSWAWSCSRFCSCLFLFFPCDCCFWESGLLESSWRQYFLFCIILFFNLKLLETHNTYSKTLHLYSWRVAE